MSKLLALVSAENIQKNVPASFYQRGQKYYYDGRVNLLSLEDETAHLHVRGSYGSNYNIRLKLENCVQLRACKECLRAAYVYIKLVEISHK